jgi:hypothetical protein
MIIFSEFNDALEEAASGVLRIGAASLRYRSL